MRRIRFCLLGLLVVAAVGCGGTRDRGKNQDLDRPKASERK